MQQHIPVPSTTTSYSGAMSSMVEEEGEVKIYNRSKRSSKDNREKREEGREGEEEEEEGECGEVVSRRTEVELVEVVAGAPRGSSDYLTPVNSTGIAGLYSGTMGCRRFYPFLNCSKHARPLLPRNS